MGFKSPYVDVNISSMDAGAIHNTNKSPQHPQNLQKPSFFQFLYDLPSRPFAVFNHFSVVQMIILFQFQTMKTAPSMSIQSSESLPRQVGYIYVQRSRKRYKLFINDLKRVFRVERRRIISIPVFQEKTGVNESTDADIEDNGGVEL